MKKSKNSNLFYINLDAIETELAEANAPLIKKAEEILEEANGYTDELSSLEEAERLKVFIRNLRNQKRDVSNARLSDGRPFAEAAGVIKQWFGITENKLKAADKRLSDMLAKYASERQLRADEARERNAKIEASKDIKDQKETVLGVSVSGETVISVDRGPNTIQQEFEKIPQVPNVELIWQVKHFDREALDLEKLRPFLTDYAIKLAINSHIKENGPNQLSGVVYEQIIAKKV